MKIIDKKYEYITSIPRKGDSAIGGSRSLESIPQVDSGSDFTRARYLKGNYFVEGCDEVINLVSTLNRLVGTLELIRILEEQVSLKKRDKDEPK